MKISCNQFKIMQFIGAFMVIVPTADAYESYGENQANSPYRFLVAPSVKDAPQTAGGGL